MRRPGSLLLPFRDPSTGFCAMRHRLHLSRAGYWQWPALLALTAPLTLLGVGLHISSAFFIGPMLGAILFSFAGSSLRLHRDVTVGSQAIIGCVVARSLDAPILLFVVAHWPTILIVVGITALAGCLVAWGLARFTSLDGPTASWGAMPGAAGVMVALAAEYGGDPRQVALMQYFRLIIVVSTASLVARLLASDTVHAVPVVVHQGAAAPFIAVAETLLIGAAGAALGRFFRIPAGPLLVTALFGVVLRFYGTVDLALPPWLLLLAYGALGWFVGLQFDRAMLVAALRTVPAIVGATFVLIAVCSAAGWVLAHSLRTDDLTGYLATSPGGIDSIAIIALGSKANTSVVMAVQTIRFFSIIVVAPYLVGAMRRFVGAADVSAPVL
jgi:membrane AbrB-like protein